MKKILKMAMTAWCLAAASNVAFAGDMDDIRLGRPGYGGTGCPGGSASITLSPDKKSLSILFDQYVAEAGQRKRIDRKTCNVAIPVHVPQGFAVSVFKIDYRGYVMVPRGGEARFNVEYFFAGKKGPRFQKRFRGGTDDEYLLSNRLAATSVAWSKCGADVNLRVNSSILARTNSRRQDVLATVDSADVNAGIVYQFQWKRCNR